MKTSALRRWLREERRREVTVALDVLAQQLRLPEVVPLGETIDWEPVDRDERAQ